MKVLIVGGNSLLGKYLLSVVPEEIEVESTWYMNYVQGLEYQLDITNKSQIAYVVERTKPDVVIICSALGSVDYAQENYAFTRAVNVDGVRNIVLAAPKSKIVFISSNAVYDGKNPPYTEDAVLHPVNIYGSLKKAAEVEARQAKKWVIIRPFMLYGCPNNGGRQNWGTVVLDKLSRGENIQAVKDVFFQPTYAGDCASMIWQLISSTNEVFNCAVEEVVSLFDFCCLFADKAGLDKRLIIPSLSSDFKTLAPRPTNTTFNLIKIKKIIKNMPTLEEGIERMLNEVSD